MSKTATTTMDQQATQALGAHESLHCPGFESSKVFALSSQLLRNPPPNLPSRKRLVRTFRSIYLFIIHPSSPLDPSNPRSKPVDGKVETSGGALRPAMWFVDLKNKGFVGKGQPPKTVLGRKTKADVVIECKDRDFVDMATGKVHPQRLYNDGRIKIRGNLDNALKIATLISHERSKIYGTPAPAPPSDARAPTAAEDFQREGHSSDDYGAGSPAPVPNRAKL
ncbi:uncharacterized protein PFL1_02401 [Pseudozyma flocculosa PF-1]|uniref:SCP2 domain-containing protein n=1 Tax=Pseudozyma flocculosa TaxID=84751 RepID=A0A5C3F7S7_9BASI|nr:uncharacterized protein PFL1_02401 [Pseudozyma flocculosa PF-1]EPQ30285.1 hypothetical protein PFL1_02401 [Pseudozyma flocculosa PF-1]SPO39775.1 uncharacterized protein PSFLO_05256 [Pseudozyma flocculosa]